MKLPDSLFFFGIALVIYILQLFPMTGIILMMMAAAFWSGPLITIGMLGLIFEPMVRKEINYFWLVIPALYFFGYAIAYKYSHAEFARLDKEVQQSTAVAPIAFDPEQHAIYISTKGQGNASRIAQRLVSKYGAGRVYSKTKHAVHADHKLFGVATFDACVEIDTTILPKKLGANTFGLGERRGYQSYAVGRKGAKSAILCGYSIEQDPIVGEKLFEFEISSSQTKSWYLGNLRQATAKVTFPDGSQQTLKSGSASTLPKFPFPIAGCALNSSAPAWICSVGFRLSKVKAMGDSARYGTTIFPRIVELLGLSRNSLKDGSAYVDKTSVAFVKTYVEKQLLKSVDHVQELIEHPNAYNHSNLNAVPGLSKRPDVIIPLAPKIVQELTRRLLEKDGIRGNDFVLQSLLSLLPDTVLRRELPPFLEALARVDRRQFKRLKLDLLKRLGSVGDDALPVLRRALLERNESGRGFASLAACHLGEVARSLVPIIYTKSTSRRKIRFDTNFSYFVAALSIGDFELSEHIRALDRNPKTDRYYAAAEEVAKTSDRRKLCRHSKEWRLDAS